jgi:hypothetical protein
MLAFFLLSSAEMSGIAFKSLIKPSQPSNRRWRRFFTARRMRRRLITTRTTASLITEAETMTTRSLRRTKCLVLPASTMVSFHRSLLRERELMDHGTLPSIADYRLYRGVAALQTEFNEKFHLIFA